MTDLDYAIRAGYCFLIVLLIASYIDYRDQMVRRESSGTVVLTPAGRRGAERITHELKHGTVESQYWAILKATEAVHKARWDASQRRREALWDESEDDNCH